MNCRKRKSTGDRADGSTAIKDRQGRGGFTDEEDTQLYAGLLKYGPLDIENLHRAVPTRSIYQIKQRINTLQKKAQASLTTVSRRLRNGAIRLETRDKVALDKWLDETHHLHQKKQIVSGSSEEMPVRMLARVMGYIAKYEVHPSPKECGGVNLKNVYEFVESMLIGVPSKALPGPDARFLLEGLQHLSTHLDITDVGRETGFVSCERPQWSCNKKTRTYGKQNQESSADNLSLFLSSPHFNPFNVPVHWLKKSIDFQLAEKSERNSS